MQQFAMIRKYKANYVDEETQEQREAEITLKGNVFTYIIYKNFTGRDLQADISKSLLTNNNQQLLSLLDKWKIKIVADDMSWFNNLTDEQRNEILPYMSNALDTEFNIYFTAALIATNEYPKMRSFEDTIMSIPPEWIMDGEFLNDIYRFLPMFIKTDVKKK